MMTSESSSRVRRYYITGSILTVTLLLGVSFGMMISADTPTGFPTIIEPGSLLQPYDFLVFKDETTYYARNGTTGGIEFSSSNATTLLNYTITHISEDGGRLIIAPGEYYLPRLGGGSPTSPTSYTNFAVYIRYFANLSIDMEGAIFYPPTTYSWNFFGILDCHNISIKGGAFDGKMNTNINTDDQLRNFIYLRNCSNIRITDVRGWDITTGLISIGAVRNCYIDGITCVGSDPPSESYPIHLHGYPNSDPGNWPDINENIMIRNVNLTKMGAYGIILFGVNHNVLIDGGEIDGDRASIRVEEVVNTNRSSKDVWIRNILFRDPEHGVDVYGINTYPTVFIDNCVFNESRVGGTKKGVYSVHSNITVTNSRFIGGDYAIHAITGGYINAQNNLFEWQTYRTMLLEGLTGIVAYNKCNSTTTYTIRSASGVVNVLVIGNYVNFPIAGNGFVCKDNYGYVTENRGSATITGAVNSVTVNHGLVTTPSIVLITGNNTGIGNSTVTSISSTQFVISFENQPGALEWKFYWYAQTW